MSTQSSTDIRKATAHEEIARRAHELWEQDDRRPGNDQKHWFEAEHQLRSVSPGEVKGIPAAGEKKKGRAA